MQTTCQLSDNMSAIRTVPDPSQGQLVAYTRCYNGLKRTQITPSELHGAQVRHPGKWTGRPASPRSGSVRFIIRANNYTQRLICTWIPEEKLDHPIEELLPTTRQLGNSKPHITIPSPYTSLPGTRRQERATSTMQNRIQLSRVILPKIHPFSRPNMPMWRTNIGTRTCYPTYERQCTALRKVLQTLYLPDTKNGSAPQFSSFRIWVWTRTIIIV